MITSYYFKLYDVIASALKRLKRKRCSLVRLLGWTQCVYDFARFGFRHYGRSPQVPALFFGDAVSQMARSAVSVQCFAGCSYSKAFFYSFVCLLFGHLFLH
jgi:hypothetical protein